MSAATANWRRKPTKPVKATPPTKLQKMLAPTDIFVNKVGDRLMATNRYWLVDADPLGPLWEWWNLTLEPGAYYVDQRVRRTLMEVPEFDKLLVEPTKRTVLRPELAAPTTPLMFESGSAWCVLFSQGKHRLGLNREFLDFAAPGWRDGAVRLEQETDQPLRPVFVRRDTTVAGVLMPVRLS